MNKKLTLRLDENLVESAKKYSAKTGKSVSKIVADLFSIINNEKIENEFEITPTVKALRGALRKTAIDERDYKDYLEEKYL